MRAEPNATRVALLTCQEPGGFSSAPHNVEPGETVGGLLADAGGWTELATQGTVHLERAVRGGPLLYPVDLWAIWVLGDHATDYVLKPGDRIRIVLDHPAK